MKNYKIQDGCRNCKNCFVVDGYQEINYYCTSGAEKRPPCSDTWVDEYDHDEDRKNGYAKGRAWTKWSRDTEVAAWGICDEYET